MAAPAPSLNAAQASARCIAGWAAEMASDLAHASHAQTPSLSIYHGSAARMVAAIRRELGEIEAALNTAPAKEFA